jgi:hypothetical protein
MFDPGVEHWLSRERVVEMRKEVGHNRLESRLVRESRLAKAASLSEEARQAKARVAAGAVGRRRSVLARGATFVTAMFR